MKVLKLILLLFTIFLTFATGFVWDLVPLYIALVFYVLSILSLLNKERLTKSLIVIGGYSMILAFSLFLGLYIKLQIPNVCVKGELKANKQWKNIKPLNVDSILIKLVEASDVFKVDTLTFASHKSTQKPIYILRNKTNSSSPKKLLLIAGVHGSEPGGVYAIPEIIERLKKHQLHKKYDIDIIPAFNPIGLSAFSRLNENNCDINRDFKSFKTNQSKALKKQVEAKQYDIVIDLHEGLFSGHFIMSTNNDLTQKVKQSLEEKEILISPLLKSRFKASFYQYQFNNFLTNYGVSKSMMPYLNEKGIECVVSESNASINDMDKRAHHHLIVFKSVIAYLEGR